MGGGGELNKPSSALYLTIKASTTLNPIPKPTGEASGKVNEKALARKGKATSGSKLSLNHFIVPDWW